MRARAYLRILLAATLLTLVATTLAPDATGLFDYPGQSARVLEGERRVFESITRPLQTVARAVGIWIDSHSAQRWPEGWPIFAALATRLALIAILFWFVAGVAGWEVLRLVTRLARGPARSPAPQ